MARPALSAAPPAAAEPPVLGLRERKKLRTQTELQQAALRLFAKHGFDQVTTDDIAAAAEVSKTTFYRYFDSKEDVLLGDPAKGLAEMRAALAARPVDEPPLDAVRAAVKDLAGAVALDRHAARLKHRLMRETPSVMARNLERQAAWEVVVADFVRPRLTEATNPDLIASVVAATVMATLRATIEHWLDADGDDDVADLVDQALAVLAIGTPGRGAAPA